jgi:UDP-N-acetylmuramoyl-tripeptide--D-alanyl-D-alanine ligase
MKELGSQSTEFHREIGSMLPGLSVDCLVAIGNDAVEYCKGAEKAGLKTSRIKYFENGKNAVEILKSLLRENDTVLIKASRSMKLEGVLDSLLEAEIVR